MAMMLCGTTLANSGGLADAAGDIACDVHEAVPQHVGKF